MEILPIVDEGLGNSSYVVGLGDGSAMVIDPFRDPSPYLAIASARGWRLRFAAETHLHADFVSGSRELGAEGAQILASAGAPVEFGARLLEDNEEVHLGGLTLRALATPGHTPEHLAYLLLDGVSPVALFSGGTLIVGGVARPDLLSRELTEPLARAAYRSVRKRILALPDGVGLYPTHGAGSFCSTGGGGERTSTIGAERAASPLLQAESEDAFVQQLLGGLGSFPPYFLQLREVNQAGPRLYGQRPPALAQLTVAQFDAATAAGAEVIDVRSIYEFSSGHVPQSLSIALRPQFATWLGWLVDRNRPIVFVADEGVDRSQLVRSCLRIGFERLTGELTGGVEAWSAAGRQLSRIPLVRPGEDDADRRIIDVRQRSEWNQAHLSGALGVELGAINDRLGELAGAPALVHCSHGERAMTAASLLARGGNRDVAVLDGGPEELAAASDLDLQMP